MAYIRPYPEQEFYYIYFTRTNMGSQLERCFLGIFFNKMRVDFLIVNSLSCVVYCRDCDENA